MSFNETKPKGSLGQIRFSITLEESVDLVQIWYLNPSQKVIIWNMKLIKRKISFRILSYSENPNTSINKRWGGKVKYIVLLLLDKGVQTLNNSDSDSFSTSHIQIFPRTQDVVWIWNISVHPCWYLSHKFNFNFGISTYMPYLRIPICLSV